MITEVPKKEDGYRMPALFIGHGSPMNAIEESNFTGTLLNLGKRLPKPRAILVISAHWLTKGTYVNASPRPKMIYDIYGFPEELYMVKYPAPGSPEMAEEVLRLINRAEVRIDNDWGFDHGNWSILKWLFPDADTPVFQMSIDYYKPVRYHYELAKELQELRSKGVLIIGSGNITHNLQEIYFEDRNHPPIDWALEFDFTLKKLIDEINHKKIIEYQDMGTIFQLAHPEPSHFIPLVYIIGLQRVDERAHHFYEGFEYGGLSMRSFIIK